MTKVELKIDGMACSMCETHVNDAIRNRLQVKKLKSSWKKGTVVFSCETAPDEETLRKILDPTGYRLLSCSIQSE